MIVTDFVVGSLRYAYILYNLLGMAFWIVLINFIEKYRAGRKSVNILEWLGVYTLELYMIHLFVFQILKGVISPAASATLFFPIAVAIALVLCKPVHDMIGKLSRQIKFGAATSPKSK